MQTERWLTHVEPKDGDHFRKAPQAASIFPTSRASVWIDPVVQQSLAASFGTREKPIPPRASALPASAITVRTRYPRIYTPAQESDQTRIPASSQPQLRQHELPESAIEGSLFPLSLINAEPIAAVQSSELSIDELDTIPPPQPLLQSQSSLNAYPTERENATQTPKGLASQSGVLRLPVPEVCELDTVPPDAATVATSGIAPEVPGDQKLIPAANQSQISDAPSWINGKERYSVPVEPTVSDVAEKQRSATHHRYPHRIRRLNLNILDRVRWWLLYPGRIEFLLWLAGTITLVAVTCLLLLISFISLGWLSVGSTQSSVRNDTRTQVRTATAQKPGATCVSFDGKNTSCYGVTTTTGKPSLIVLSRSPLLAGSSIRLRGQGFTTNGRVDLLYDSGFPCLPETVQADGYGEFDIYVKLGTHAGPGQHTLIANDTASKHSTFTTVSFVASPIGKGVTPAPTTPALPDTTPTATPGDGNSGGGPSPIPSAVSQTPVVPTPTVGATPTPAVPTPTAGTTPTPIPTQKPTPIPTVTPPTSADITPTPHTHASPYALTSLAFLHHMLLNEQSLFGPWLWSLLVSYICGMVLLGIAGLLRHRR